MLKLCSEECTCIVRAAPSSTDASWEGTSVTCEGRSLLMWRKNHTHRSTCQATSHSPHLQPALRVTHRVLWAPGKWMNSAAALQARFQDGHQCALPLDAKINAEVVGHLLVYAQHPGRCHFSCFPRGGPWASSDPTMLGQCFAELLPGLPGPELAGLGSSVVPAPARGPRDAVPGTALSCSEHDRVPGHMNWKDLLLAPSPMM